MYSTRARGLLDVRTCLLTDWLETSLFWDCFRLMLARNCR